MCLGKLSCLCQYFIYLLSHIFVKMILFIRLIGFLGLPCLIFLNCMYIFNLNGKMIIKQNKKKTLSLGLRKLQG